MHSSYFALLPSPKVTLASSPPAFPPLRSAPPLVRRRIPQQMTDEKVFGPPQNMIRNRSRDMVRAGHVNQLKIFVCFFQRVHKLEHAGGQNVLIEFAHDDH